MLWSKSRCGSSLRRVQTTSRPKDETAPGQTVHERWLLGPEYKIRDKEIVKTFLGHSAQTILKRYQGNNSRTKQTVGILEPLCAILVLLTGCAIPPRPIG